MAPISGMSFEATETDGLPAALMLRAAATSSFGMTLADARQPDHPLLYANDAFTAMTGYDAREVVGQNCRFLQGPETDPESVAKIRQTLKSGVASTVLLLNYRKDGSRFWNRFQLSPVNDDAGKLCAYLGMQVDITEEIDRIGMENERQKLETLGRVAGGVAHELNNALQPILLYAELLADEDARNPAMLNQCSKGIFENARFASDVVNQVLSFARRDSSSNLVYDARTIIGEAVDFAAEYLPSSIVFDRQGFEPGGPLDGKQIKINRTGLLQVMTNLFKNAADATRDKGRIVVTLWLSGDPAARSGHSDDPQNYVVISIADNGHGIESKTLKHIFEPFYTTKAPGEGTGLGLSTIYGIVERWGGRIAAHSTPGKGTTFRVLVPITSNA
ncbi:ATP-binding protein [Pelagibius sp. Alg239-R121]|uniref:ATP-binding protein n=1 Tax=Pelagibius sp. Alg239-R121 TaxID=2993448 RepID=UPI0024A7A1A7|nr:ATP-binding protein [Pelagibius sp. Alg239-R121]